MENSLSLRVAKLVPLVYDDTIQRLDIHPCTDMSRSNQCHNLTLGLYQALQDQDNSRRELHQAPDDLWHYVVAHEPKSVVPTQKDIITDLNPWQYTDDKHFNGFLHGERQAIQEALEDAGAPAWFVALRGISTITEAHSEKLTPFARS